MIRRLRAWWERLLDEGWNDTPSPERERESHYLVEPTGPLRQTYWGKDEPPRERLRAGDVWRHPSGLVKVWQGDHWADAL